MDGIHGLIWCALEDNGCFALQIAVRGLELCRQADRPGGGFRFVVKGPQAASA